MLGMEPEIMGKCQKGEVKGLLCSRYCAEKEPGLNEKEGEPPGTRATNCSVLDILLSS